MKLINSKCFGPDLVFGDSSRNLWKGRPKEGPEHRIYPNSISECLSKVQV